MGYKFKVEVLEFGIQHSIGFRMEGLRFWGKAFRVTIIGLRVWGLWPSTCL